LQGNAFWQKDIQKCSPIMVPETILFIFKVRIN